ncbi:MAG: aminotransferase class I/II-fold pyridoxal phosphate-dependent enzyme [Nitrospiraceae bacterium]|nr:aminotransferase class I/II-fold pyridoxal phosphate-dependent enzyme [Nitrospiraceae bacterium]
MYVMESPPGAETVINGKRYLYFCGVSYHGLHGHPDIIRTASEALAKYGMNPATTRAGFGNNPPTLELERRAAEFFGEEKALYFISGYLAPMMLVRGLAPRFDVVFVDEFSHYCVRDAAQLSGKPTVGFRHRDAEDLARKMADNLRSGQRPLVLSDAVFPTFGPIPPVPAYLELAESRDGIVVLDDAHGVGVLGANGRGVCEHLGLASDRLYFCATMSKAFGALGGIIPGTTAFIEQLRRTTMIPNAASGPDVAATAAGVKGLEILSTHPEMRERLRANATSLRDGLRKLGFDTGTSPTPIVAWTLNDEERMKTIQAELLERGIAIAHFKYVGAPPGGVLRAVVFSTHTQNHLDRLLDALREVL